MSTLGNAATTKAAPQQPIQQAMLSVGCAAPTRGDAAYEREMGKLDGTLSDDVRRLDNRVIHCPNPTDDCPTAMEFKAKHPKD